MRKLNVHSSYDPALTDIHSMEASPEDDDSLLAGSSDNSSAPPPHNGFGDNGITRVVEDDTEDGAVPADANASGKSIVLARTNHSNSDLVGVDLNLFHYEALVTNFTHNLTTINEEQWPENFCVNMKLVAPVVNREIEHRHPPERCILLLGGDDSDGSFNIYIDEFDQVGMGVMGQGDPEELATDGIGPLETRFDNNSIQAGHLYNLSFCYDTINGDASIWEDQKLYISGKKIWDFPRRGQVSAFVGSHTVGEDGTLKQALLPEDEAQLYEIHISQGTTTTTSSSTFAMAAATTSENWEEVNVNAAEETKGSKFVMEGTTTTTSTSTTSTSTTTTTTVLPHLHQFADNATIKIVNKTVETVTDRTVVTETTDGDSKSTKEVVSMPKAVQDGMPVTTNGSHHVTWNTVKTVVG
jgi:hypothetical protein